MMYLRGSFYVRSQLAQQGKDLIVILGYLILGHLILCHLCFISWFCWKACFTWTIHTILQQLETKLPMDSWCRWKHGTYSRIVLIPIEHPGGHFSTWSTDPLEWLLVFTLEMVFSTIPHSWTRTNTMQPNIYRCMVWFFLTGIPIIRWINDSPRVNSNMISADLLIGAVLESVTCELFMRRAGTTLSADCKGRV